MNNSTEYNLAMMSTVQGGAACNFQQAPCPGTVKEKRPDTGSQQQILFGKTACKDETGGLTESGSARQNLSSPTPALTKSGPALQDPTSFLILHRGHSLLAILYIPHRQRPMSNTRTSSANNWQSCPPVVSEVPGDHFVAEPIPHDGTDRCLSHWQNIGDELGAVGLNKGHIDFSRNPHSLMKDLNHVVRPQPHSPS